MAGATHKDERLTHALITVRDISLISREKINRRYLLFFCRPFSDRHYSLCRKCPLGFGANHPSRYGAWGVTSQSGHSLDNRCRNDYLSNRPEITVLLTKNNNFLI